MTVTIPDIDITPENVEANRIKIAVARQKMRAMLDVLDGLDRANAAMCTHPNKFAVYDPGYAGGGYSNSECPDCDARLP